MAISNPSFIGVYDCRLDIKSRIMLPAALNRQMPAEAQGRFVINRGFERCLVLYPITVWEVIKAKVSGLNSFRKDHREFQRKFYNGATEVALDSAHRLLIPKHLLEYAQIDKDLWLTAMDDKIEIWSDEKYRASQDDTDSEEYADLAERVMGGGGNGNDLGLNFMN